MKWPSYERHLKASSTGDGRCPRLRITGASLSFLSSSSHPSPRAQLAGPVSPPHPLLLFVAPQEREYLRENWMNRTAKESEGMVGNRLLLTQRHRYAESFKVHCTVSSRRDAVKKNFRICHGLLCVRRCNNVQSTRPTVSDKAIIKLGGRFLIASTRRRITIHFIYIYIYIFG